MEKTECFNKNLLSLKKRNPELAGRLEKHISLDRQNSMYKVEKGRSGSLIPHISDLKGSFKPLHSLINPQREAYRLLEITEGGFIILLGLGGAYHALAALENKNTAMLLLIDYNLEDLAGLFFHIDYTPLFNDIRFHILIDPKDYEIENHIIKNYYPVIFGNINILPLRARTNSEPELFNKTADIISSSIEKISSDFSVQSHFGLRWFSNIIKNVFSLEKSRLSGDIDLPKINKAAICAAGPSLSIQLEEIKMVKNDHFIISTDTALPSLLNADIKPDAVISLDCQHIGYQHFFCGIPDDTFFFLDIASPPSFSSLSKKPVFFTGSHPLGQYISANFCSLPVLDLSGGNVSHGALSLAEFLGAEEIILFGADFSYPMGISYAKGTYIYSHFEKFQKRFNPLEAQTSAFLYRSPLEKIQKKDNEKMFYYESNTLKTYRNKLEEKSLNMNARIRAAKGLGAPIKIQQENSIPTGNNPGFNPEKFIHSKPSMEGRDFIKHYTKDIENLPVIKDNPVEYLSSLDKKSLELFTCLLPAMAAIQKKNTEDKFPLLFEKCRKIFIDKLSIPKA